jgi:hypothetical protein
VIGFGAFGAALGGFDVVFAGDPPHVGGGEGRPVGYVGGAFPGAEGRDDSLHGRVSGFRVRFLGLAVAACGLVKVVQRVHAKQGIAFPLRNSKINRYYVSQSRIYKTTG